MAKAFEIRELNFFGIPLCIVYFSLFSRFGYFLYIYQFFFLLLFGMRVHLQSHSLAFCNGFLFSCRSNSFVRCCQFVSLCCCVLPFAPFHSAILCIQNCLWNRFKSVDRFVGCDWVYLSGTCVRFSFLVCSLLLVFIYLHFFFVLFHFSFSFLLSLLWICAM